MGCFNKIGFYSNLPINYGDNIVYFICMGYKSVGDSSSTPIAPFGIMSPLCLPIFGEYDDYGSIENIIRDSNTDYIERLFDLDINFIIQAIDMCAGCTINDVSENERLNSKYNKQHADNYIKIMNILQDKCLKHYSSVLEVSYLIPTMELCDVYNFACRKYYNKNGEQKLNDIVSFMNQNNIESVNIFDKYSNSLDSDLLKAISDKIEDNDKLKKLLEKEKIKHKLSHLIAEYSNYNCFQHCSIFTLEMYKGGNFKVLDNVKLINDFSSFCLCLTLNCINFNVSSYGNQSILDECDSLIDLHKEFIKILKTKKKQYE